MAESSQKGCYMGVDTGKRLHVVILQEGRTFTSKPHRLVYLTECGDFSELNELVRRFNVRAGVIDGLPETHATRAFARSHGSWYPCFFSEHQRGMAKWERDDRAVTVNRTEALDASRAAIREAKFFLPRRAPLVEVLARHMSADAKVLDEVPDTGALKYRYVPTGVDHYSLAFTYAWMAIGKHHMSSIPVSFGGAPPYEPNDEEP